MASAATEAYRALGGGQVAVRSSATAEDLPGASFAGQQETYLHREGSEEVLDAVRLCWSSLWTPRAMTYRARQGISPGDVALAVVVQRMVESESAGVLFTDNPVTGHRSQMVIDGAWGLGEAVVSGQVTPDQWVVDGNTGAMLLQSIARKEVMTVRCEGGTETVPVPPELQEEPVLDQEGIRTLVELGRQVGAHFGSPQDIEWAWAKGKCYLVQSRPITSLFPLPEPQSPAEAGLRVHVSFNVIQGIVEPFTPMGIDMFRYAAAALLGFMGQSVTPGEPAPFMRVAAGRIYVDLTDLIRHPQARPAVAKGPGVTDQPTAAILQDLMDREPRLAPVAKSSRLRPPLGLLVRLGWRAIGALLRPDAARRRALKGMEAAVADLERQAGSLTSLEQRRRFLQKASSRMFPMLLGNMLPVVAPGLAMRFVAEERLRKWLGDGSGIQVVTRALRHNPTTEMDLELWRLSRRLKAERVQPSAEHPGVKAFLARYGHRTVREIDVGMPRWREDPFHVLNILQTYLSQDEDHDPEAHFRRSEAEAEQAAVEMVARVRREKGKLRAAGLRFLFSRVRALAGLREYPKFYMVRIVAILRGVIAAMGRDLVAAGRLDQEDDVYFLTLQDLLQERDLRMAAAAHREQYQQELGRRSIPRVITSEGETFYTPKVEEEGALTGTGASPGVFEGVVQVIHDPRGAALASGEVLVAPGTDPAWTPLFLTAGALVMEIGGIMSHGSIVAREYGIPAVVGVTEATTRLQTGQRVRVDGESGVVVPLD